MTEDWIVERLAALTARVKQLEQERVGYVQAPVTAVDAASSTFTVQPPAQQDGAAQELAGLSSPAHFLPAVGDQVTLAVAGAQPIYQPQRIAAEAVGYTELNPTVTLDIDGKNSVTFSTSPPSGSGKTVNDLWWQTSGTSGTSVVGGWQWDGGTWQPHTFGDQILDSLTAAKITSGQVAAGTVIDVGNPAGEHTEITDSVIKFVGLAPDGSQVDVTQLGQQNGGVDPDTGLQTWAIDQLGAASFQDLSTTNDPIFQGTPLSVSLDGFSSFLAGGVEGADVDPAQTASTGSEVGYYEAAMEFQPGHQYRIQTSNIWVRPTGTSPATRIDVNLRYTVSGDPATDPPAVSITSPLFARWSQSVSGSLGHGVVISRLFHTSVYAHIRFLITLSSTGGGAFIEMGSANTTDPILGVIQPEVVQLFAEDLGGVAWTNRAVKNTGGGGTAPAPVKRYTYDYFSHWSRCFRGDGSVFNDNGDCYQGQTPYYPANGDMATQIGGFTRTGGNSLHADLNGATVESLYVYLYANHWNYYDGGTAVIRYHNNATAGSLNNFAGGISVPGWARSQGRWVDITSWASLFQGTAAQGIQVGKANSTDPTFYGIFDGPAGDQPPRLRCTFTK